MASYIHTCTACGVEMTVHERYYGRTLRCRECRAEFLAGPAQPDTPPGVGRPTSSTLHTCTACGTVMHVAERYFGRALRCTGCGEEFTARLPVVRDVAAGARDGEVQQDPAAADPAAVVSRPGPASRPGRVRMVLILFGLLVGVAALVWWLGGDRGQGFGSSLFTAEKQRTQIGELRLDGEVTVPVALDREAFDQLQAAIRSGDRAEIQAFRASPRCLALPTGTRVRVLERRKRGTEARVRILDGPESSRIVWVPIGWVK
jgi:DNA-directed RNA polymerase subunit M/transcription elongation factor TFIIS